MKNKISYEHLNGPIDPTETISMCLWLTLTSLLAEWATYLSIVSSIRSCSLPPVNPTEGATYNKPENGPIKRYTH